MLWFIGDTPPDQLSALIISFAIIVLFGFAYHELAHAVVADWLGDPTPRRHGRMTMNPLPHLDRTGFILAVIFGFGWAFTPINPNALRGNPRQSHAIVAIAGPLANLLMAVLFALPIRLGLVVFSEPTMFLPTPYYFLQLGVLYNVLLFGFNLLPIPPLDGFTILQGVLPPEIAYRMDELRPHSMIIFLAVVFLLPRIGFDVIGLFLDPLYKYLLPFLLGW